MPSEGREGEAVKRDFVGAVMAVPSKMDVDRGKPIV